MNAVKRRRTSRWHISPRRANGRPSRGNGTAQAKPAGATSRPRCTSTCGISTNGTSTCADCTNARGTPSPSSRLNR